jgi:hypothetical protein
LKQKFTVMQRREISGIAWKSIDEVRSLIRPHHIERLSMVQKVCSVAETFETD